MTRNRRRPHRGVAVRSRGAVLLVLLAAMASACSGGGQEPDAGATSSPTGSPTPSPDPVEPLTGRPAADPATLDRPALAIKVSDVPEAHPQVGVDRADIVFVEPVGPSYTRLAAVFHSDLPEEVGPVRSVRPMDAALLSPLSPVFGNSMGAEWVMRYVDEVGTLDDLGTLRVRGSGAYVQDPQREAPNHVFARPDVLLDLSDFTDPPDGYFPHSSGPDDSSAAMAGDPGRSVTIPYGPSYDVTWTYDEAEGRYLRDEPWGPHVTADGTRVGADNVLVLSVPSVVEKLADGAGAPVPVLQLVDASGSVLALSGGNAVRGTWSKGDVDEPFELRTDAGKELVLAPGTTWVELPEPSADVTVG